MCCCLASAVVIVCTQVGRQLEVQEQLLHGLEAQLKERERAVSGGRNNWNGQSLKVAAAAAAAAAAMEYKFITAMP
jgi:hypothetical protein